MYRAKCRHEGDGDPRSEPVPPKSHDGTLLRASRCASGSAVRIRKDAPGRGVSERQIHPIAPAILVYVEADRRLLDSAEPGARRRDAALSEELERRFPRLGPVRARFVYSSVHDVARVDAGESSFALKLYRPGTRTIEDISWEIDLHRHLSGNGAPVAPLEAGLDGLIEHVVVDGTERTVVLTAWASGTKPQPSTHTYRLVGRAAAAIHNASDSFSSLHTRAPRTVETEIDRQVALLRPAFEHVGRFREVEALARRAASVLARGAPERGVCHCDLTLDNVHIENDTITVFDFDSAAEHWRAAEPQGVFHSAAMTGTPWWDAWRAGYAEVRDVAEEDETYVPWFVLIAQLENTAWKLGLTPTSVGALLQHADLPLLVDTWMLWAETHCAPSL